MTYQPTDSEVDELAEKITTALAGLYGFPATPDAVLYLTRRLLQIIWCRRTSEIPALKGEPHSTIGDVRDDDWIIGEIADRYDRFPPLITWRRLYCAFLPPRDGRELSEMEAQ